MVTNDTTVIGSRVRDPIFSTERQSLITGE